jgi:serine/threonine protein kinase
MRLGGVSEVADEIGVSPQRMRTLRMSDGSTFPAPVAELSAGPVWDLDEVGRWNAARRGPGRPPLNVLGGRFELEDQIGTGGFADVYRAVDREHPDDVVAVKVLRQSDQADGLERFKRELRLLQDLTHPNVIPVLGSGIDGRSRPWYAMPLAVGNLHEVLDQFVDSEEDIIDVMLQVCAGLQHLHESEDDEGQAIYHRDLCPQNILRTSEATWAIADFGLAREAERRSTALTNSSIVLGHIQYLAPEQLSGLKGAEVPADIYSIGRTLQALVLGRDPSVFEHFEEESVFRPVIKRATRQDPAERYGSVAEIIADLRAIELAPKAPWESPIAQMERLREKVREPGPISARTLDELRSAVIKHRELPEARKEAARAMPSLGEKEIAYLFDANTDDFVQMIEIWGQAVQESSFGFDFCDSLADFGERAVVAAAPNDEVLAAVLRALVELGKSHNRWHVRSVVVRLLQKIRERDEALVALAALRDSRPEAVAWSVTEFARQSLHPLLRDGLAAISD